jgi:cysteine desulfurase/selenocysteine lyase
MIQEVTEDGFTIADVPAKFEPGTLPIAEAVGLEAAINWLEEFSEEEVTKHEHDLLSHACKKLQEIDGVKILGPNNDAKRFGCVSFTIDGAHPHDLTELLGQKGFCLRAGHLCADPLHAYLKISASTRLSVAIYNTKEEIDACSAAIQEAATFLRGR